MSIRDSLLAILTLGPAYGLQLHGELEMRAPHRVPVNVGQIYSTLDRSIRAGLVESAGSTTDGLPLYRLTLDGERAAVMWMSPTSVDSVPAWPDLLDQVLVTATISTSRSRLIVDALISVLSVGDESADKLEAAGRIDPIGHAAAAARAAQADAALTWLCGTARELVDGTVARREVERAVSAQRPRRGRPASAA